jgi:predicted nuclease of predicted toxin-antitoxin system
VKLLIDMNLAPRWVEALARGGIDSIHWIAVGDPRAPDSELFNYARDNNLIVFTHDLDFGIMLAMTAATGPSVVQVRSESVAPEAIVAVVVAAITEHRGALDAGAIVTVDPAKARVRILPIR